MREREHLCGNLADVVDAQVKELHLLEVGEDERHCGEVVVGNVPGQQTSNMRISPSKANKEMRFASDVILSGISLMLFSARGPKCQRTSDRKAFHSSFRPVRA